MTQERLTPEDLVQRMAAILLNLQDLTNETRFILDQTKVVLAHRSAEIFKQENFIKENFEVLKEPSLTLKKYRIAFEQQVRKIYKNADAFNKQRFKKGNKS